MKLGEGVRLEPDYLRLPIRRPGSGELMDTKFPCSSRVVWNRSLVRPVILLCSSRITAVASSKPLVTDPMIRCLPSRMYFFSSDMFPPLSHSQYTKHVEKTASFRG